MLVSSSFFLLNDQIGELVDGPGEGSSNQVLDGIHYDYGMRQSHIIQIFVLK